MGEGWPRAALSLSTHTARRTDVRECLLCASMCLVGHSKRKCTSANPTIIVSDDAAASSCCADHRERFPGEAYEDAFHQLCGGGRIARRSRDGIRRRHGCDQGETADDHRTSLERPVFWYPYRVGRRQQHRDIANGSQYTWPCVRARIVRHRRQLAAVWRTGRLQLAGRQLGRRRRG